MTEFKVIESAWNESENPIWLFSRLSIHRNIKNYKFPGKMSVEERSSLCELLKNVFCSYKKLKGLKSYQASDLEPVMKDYLYEHFLNPTPLQHIHQGEGLCYDQKGEVLCLMNYIDHLRLNFVGSSHDLFEIWKKLVACELHLEKELGFAFSSRFGFLSAHPNECGTAVDIRVFLQVPALIYTGEFDAASLSKETIGVESLEGGKESYIGDLVVLKNQTNLGFKEEVLLSHIQEMAMKLVVQEQGKRKELIGTADTELYDLVGRAFGLLKHSHSIDMHEALDALGKIRLGLDLGWIKNMNHKKLNKLLFTSRRGHLCVSGGLSSTSPKEVNAERASFFRKAFKRVSFKV